MKLKLLLLVPFVATICHSAYAQSPQYREDIRQIVEMTLPSKKATETLLTPLIARLKPRYPNVDSANWASISTELREFVLSEFNAPNGIVDKLIGSYQRRLTEREASEIAAFFRSEAGRKFVQQRDEVAVELLPVLDNEARRLSPIVEAQFNVLVKKYAP